MAEITSSIRRRLPLGGLRTFEAAARLGSFRRAAEELGVTATAVSHRIRDLEAMLGVKLFLRGVRQVSLTREGSRLFPVLREGFDGFAAAIGALAPEAGVAVTLSAPVAFTARRLLPSMARFREACPRVQLRLHASDDPVDLRSGAADLAIRYGHGPFDGLIAEPLFVDGFVPVCSPRLGLEDRRELAGATLIHTEWRNPAPDTPTWARWAAAAGVRGLEHRPGLSFTDESHAIEAAVAGLGVALASRLLVARELASGLLVAPFGPELPGRPYQLLLTASAPPAVEAVADWVRSLAAAPA